MKSRLDLLDKYSLQYSQAVDEGDRMLADLEELGQTPEAEELTRKIEEQKDLVENLRLEFNANYGPLSNNAHESRRCRLHFSKVVFNLGKLRGTTV